MDDSYRPSNRPRGRDRDDHEHSGRSFEYDDLDSAHRRRRSRSPPRTLDYEDGAGDVDTARDRYEDMPDGGYGHGVGVGLRKVRHHSDIDNRSGVLKYAKYRPRSPMRDGILPERRLRYDANAEYRHYGHDEYPARPANRGDKDGAADSKPYHTLLVRGLKETVHGDLLAKDMEKLYEGFDNNLGGAPVKSIWRVFIIRDKRTEQRMGYGFVQYYTTQDAIAALSKARQMQRNGNTLKIGAQDFSISYAHPFVFQHYDFGKVERDPKHLFQGPDKKFKYNDERYYPEVYVINEDSPHPAVLQPKNSSDSETKSKKSSKDTLDGKTKKRKTPASVPKYLEYYQKKQAELREDEQNATDSDSKLSAQPGAGVNAISNTDADMPDAPADTASTPAQPTYAYEGKGLIACFLCNSSFNTRDGVVRHIKVSKMHAKYLLDPKDVDRAEKRMQQKGLGPESMLVLTAEESSPPKPVPSDPQPQYRDRAAERRQEEAKAGVVHKVGFSLKGKGSKASTAAAASARNSDGEAEKGSTQPTYGKGLDMLQKAGWTAGKGLGVHGGEGIAAPIDTNVYAAGVGLGHEGSKRGDAAEEAARATNGNGFLEGTKEAARKRFAGLE